MIESPSNLLCRDLSDADLLEHVLAIAHRNMDRLGYLPVERSRRPAVSEEAA